LKKKIRAEIFKGHGPFYNMLQKIYKSLWKIRCRRYWESPHLFGEKASFGELNPDVTFYVIRREPEIGGLCSHIIFNMLRIIIAEKKKMIPIIDMENYPTYYNEDEPINGTMNAWEYYFDQPSSVTLEEVYKSKNVVLSDLLWPGRKFLPDFYGNDFLEDTDNQLEYCCEIVRDYMHFNKYTMCKLNEALASIKRRSGGGDILAVMSRGTDFKKLKPFGHHIQPEPEWLIDKSKEIMRKFDIKYCFLNTEEKYVLDMFKCEFGKNLLFLDHSYYDDFNKIEAPCQADYTDANKHLFIGEYIKKTNEKSKFELTFEYLCNVFIASKCEYLLCGKNGGSIAAILFNNRQYKRKFIVELGMYE
jgi:hypothetical protein